MTSLQHHPHKHCTKTKSSKVSHSPSTLLFCVVSMTHPNVLWAWCYSHLNINMWRAKNDQSEGTLSLLFPLPFNPKDDDVWRIIHFMGSFISFICLRGQIKLSSIKEFCLPARLLKNIMFVSRAPLTVLTHCSKPKHFYLNPPLKM